MSGQQIDSLTVGVGLTQEDFEAGVQKILRSLGQMREQTAETGESMTSSLSSVGGSVLGLGLKFAGLFIAIKGIEDVVGYFKNLSVELANLGFAGRYLGQSAVELSRFGEVAKLAGGNTQDAITAVQSLQSAIFGLEFQGQISQNLLQLQRLGVGYLTTAGQMRPLKDIAMETAAALQRQLPGKANEAMRVQWAAQIFGAGGLANAVGGGLAELRKFYSESARDQKSITQRAIDTQVRTQQDLTRLSADIRSEATDILTRLTPAIQDLIKVIRDRLVPTIDEAISDLMVFLHPGSAVDTAMGGKGVGPLGFSHPLNTFEAIGIGLGIRAGQLHDWWMKQLQGYNTLKLNSEMPAVPPQVEGRLALGTNSYALRLLHLEAGGDQGDPTWSKAITAYGGLAQYPGGVTGYIREAVEAGAPSVGNTVSPRTLPLHALGTPAAHRPIATPTGTSKPTASNGGPRVQIGTIGPIYTQARDANGLMADINRAAQRKLLVAQADPGLA